MLRCRIPVGCLPLLLLIQPLAMLAATPDDHKRPPPGHGPPPSPLIMVLDTDKDGELSADEIKNAAKSLLQLDQNADGKLSRDEFCPPPPPQNGKQEGAARSSKVTARKGGQQRGQRPPPPPGPLLQALDTDKDGELSAQEIANAPKSLLQVDKNGDGKLSRDELLPPPPPRDAGDPGNN